MSIEYMLAAYWGVHKVGRTATRAYLETGAVKIATANGQTMNVSTAATLAYDGFRRPINAESGLTNKAMPLDLQM